jgi:hypothetical protein
MPGMPGMLGWRTKETISTKLLYAEKKILQEEWNKKLNTQQRQTF